VAGEREQGMVDAIPESSITGRSAESPRSIKLCASASTSGRAAA